MKKKTIKEELEEYYNERTKKLNKELISVCVIMLLFFMFLGIGAMVGAYMFHNSGPSVFCTDHSLIPIDAWTCKDLKGNFVRIHCESEYNYSNSSYTMSCGFIRDVK